jgi:hypothetical protein
MILGADIFTSKEPYKMSSLSPSVSAFFSEMSPLEIDDDFMSVENAAKAEAAKKVAEAAAVPLPEEEKPKKMTDQERAAAKAAAKAEAERTARAARAARADAKAVEKAAKAEAERTARAARADAKAVEKAAKAAKEEAERPAKEAAKAERAAKQAAERANKKAAAKLAAAEKSAVRKAKKTAFKATQIKTKLFEEKEECQICYEPLNLSSNKPVVCQYASCGYKSCMSCIRTYLLGNPQSAAHCMSCKKPFDNLFLVQNLTKAWTNDKYYPTIYNTLTEMELARLPEAMEEAENRKRASERIVEIKKGIKNICDTVFYPGREIECYFSYLPDWTIAHVRGVEFYEQYGDYYIIIRFTSTNASWTLGNQRRGVRSCHNDFEVDVAIDTIIQLQNELSEQKRIEGGGSQTKPKDKKVFTMPCAYNECKGMLSTEYMCGICNKYTCKDCHEPLQDEHKCNPDTVATAKAILKETRPCPSCNTRIYKIEGCDQMWCTNCKTPFSWNTGEIVPIGQRLHNPHAIEYMRRSGNTVRAPGDLVCGGVITYEQLNQLQKNIENMLPYMLSFDECNPGKLEESLQYKLPENIEKNNNISESTINISESTINISKSIINDVTTKIYRDWRVVDQVSRNKLRESREVAQAHRDFNEERVQYILNEINKDNFTNSVTEYTKYKKAQMDMSNIWELVSNFGIDMFNALYNASVCNNIVSVVSFIKLAFQKSREFDALVKYANTQLAVVSVAHSISIPKMNIENVDYDSVFRKERYSQIALKIMLSEQ